MEVNDFEPVVEGGTVAVDRKALLEFVLFAKDDTALQHLPENSEVKEALRHLDGRLDEWADIHVKDPLIVDGVPVCPECRKGSLRTYVGGWQEGFLTSFKDEGDDRVIFEGSTIHVDSDIGVAKCNQCDTFVRYDV